MTTVLYSGSFDPVTFGHLDVMRRAARLFDRVVVGVGAHHSKNALFTPEERVLMIVEAASAIEAEEGCGRIEVVTFDGLVVEAAREVGASAIVRGLRNAADFDYEEQMAGMNRALEPAVEVVYVSPSPAVRHIASSLVRQICTLGGPIDAFVPPQVAERLRARLKR